MNPYTNITAALEGVLAEAKDKSLEALYQALQEPGVGSASAGRLLRMAVDDEHGYRNAAPERG